MVAEVMGRTGTRRTRSEHTTSFFPAHFSTLPLSIPCHAPYWHARAVHRSGMIAQLSVPSHCA